MSRHFLIWLILLSVCITAAGKDSLSMRKVQHEISVAASAGYNLPSHGYYNGFNPAGRPIYANSSLHLEYGIGFNRQTLLGSLYPGVTQGVGVSMLTFYNHELMGTPGVAYLFQTGRLLGLSQNLNLDYRWNLGGSWGWKRTEMVGTRTNVYVNVGLMLTWELSDKWSLSLGPEYFHFSNGDTFYPNGGANLMNLRVGVTGYLHPEADDKDRTAIKEYEAELRGRSLADRMSYDLSLCGGFRAGKVTEGTYATINETFPFFCVNFTPLYRLNRHFSVGAALDVLADRSADIYDVVKDDETLEVISFKQPGLASQMAAGLSARADITLSVFTLGAGFGGFVLGSSKTLRGIYTTFSLKAFVTGRLFLNLTYRLSSRNYTHSLMYGIGWRLGSR